MSQELDDDNPLGHQVHKLERKSSSNSLCSASSSTASNASSSGEWQRIPEAVCVYHQKGACLRLNCRYFHGPASQLESLRTTNATHYRFDDKNAVEVTSEPDATQEAALGVRFGNAKREAGAKKPIVCLSYIAGTCRRQDCRFTHLPDHVRPLPSSVCAYHAAGTCKRATCRYYHGSEATLDAWRSQGITMYNPITNEPYERIPRFEEPAHMVGDGGGDGGAQRSGSNSGSGTPAQKNTEIPLQHVPIAPGAPQQPQFVMMPVMMMPQAAPMAAGYPQAGTMPGFAHGLPPGTLVLPPGTVGAPTMFPAYSGQPMAPGMFAYPQPPMMPMVMMMPGPNGAMQMVPMAGATPSGQPQQS